MTSTECIPTRNLNKSAWCGVMRNKYLPIIFPVPHLYVLPDIIFRFFIPSGNSTLTPGLCDTSPEHFHQVKTCSSHIASPSSARPQFLFMSGTPTHICQTNLSWWIHSHILIINIELYTHHFCWIKMLKFNSQSCIPTNMCLGHFFIPLFSVTRKVMTILI